MPRSSCLEKAISTPLSTVYKVMHIQIMYIVMKKRKKIVHASQNAKHNYRQEMRCRANQRRQQILEDNLGHIHSWQSSRGRLSPRN
jgi:hypothetical protein